jgi:hypothetical protein
MHIYQQFATETTELRIYCSVNYVPMSLRPDVPSI